jgi:hemerythrin
MRARREDERSPSRSRRNREEVAGGQDRRSRRESNPQRFSRDDDLTGPGRLPSGGIRMPADDEAARRGAPGSVQARFGRLRDDRPRQDPDDEDGPDDGHRRQLLTSVLALGGLGLTGLVASRMSEERPATAVIGTTTSPTSPASASAGRDPGPGTSPYTNSPTGSSEASADDTQPATSPGGWQKSLILGSREIDGQHERLLDLIDQLEEVMRLGQSRRKQAAALTDLLAWTKVHFAFEESLMDNYGLTASATHKAHHREFLEQVETVTTKFTAGTVNLTSKLIGTLRSWQKDHIVKDDLRLVNELNAQGVPLAF